MAGEVRPAPVWRRVFAAILDFLMVFFLAGYAIAKATGAPAPEGGVGFQLTGAPALTLFAVIVVYFVLGRKVLGGTLWDRILGIHRPQPY